MKKVLMLGFAVLAATILGISAIAGAKDLPTIRSVENDWPPYFFKGKSQGLPGFGREVLAHCIPKTGFKVQFTFYPVKRMYAYLEKGEIDLALFSYKKSREEFLHYGREPLFISGYRPVVRADSGIQIQSISDFDGLKLGHLAGLKYSRDFFSYLEKRRAKGTLVTGTTGDSCLKMLTRGMIDVFVDTGDTVRWRARQMGVKDKITILSYDIRTRPYYVTLSRRSPRITDKQGFLEKLDLCLKQMKADGTYGKISAKYGL